MGDDDEVLNYEWKNTCTSNVHEPSLLYLQLNKESFAAVELVDSIVAVDITRRVSVGVMYSTSTSIYRTIVHIYDRSQHSDLFGGIL